MNCFVKHFVVLLSVVGCSAGAPILKAPTYDVKAKNSTNVRIDDVKVAFDDGSWEFEFGIANPLIGKKYLGIVGMPPMPETATVTWTDGAGSSNEAVVNLPADKSYDSGELRIEIEGNNKAKATFIPE